MKKRILFSLLIVFGMFAIIFLTTHMQNISPFEVPADNVTSRNKDNGNVAPSASNQPTFIPELASTSSPSIKPRKRLPAPLIQLSYDELQRFPQGVVIDYKVDPIPNTTTTKQTRIIKSDTDLGFIRTEEIVDPTSGELIQRAEMIANSILVKIKIEYTPSQLLSKNPTLLKSYRQLMADEPVYEIILHSHDTSSLPRGLDFMKTLEGEILEYSEPNPIKILSKEPNDPDFNNLWGLFQISAPRAWDTRSETTPYPIVVAVVDTGVDYTHEDLKDNMWKNPNEVPGNGLDDDKNGYIDDVHGIHARLGLGKSGNGNPMDTDGHGTHVAGTIAAVGNNNIGVVGVAWNLIKTTSIPTPKRSGGIMAVKALSSSGGTDADIAVCISYALKQGADIINLSLGGFGESRTFRDSIARAKGKGVILVCAAGNDGLDIDRPENFTRPACYEDDNIVSVGASNDSDQPADFSNFGKVNVDIFAPGDEIYSTWPKSFLPPHYRFESGTSMATPHVSGCLALLKAQYPSEGYKGWISRLFGKADKNLSYTDLCKTGARVNLYQSINNITVRPTPTPKPTPITRLPPPNRGGVSRDFPTIGKPTLPNPKPTPITKPAPAPRPTPRPKVTK
jgi:hypothetical protein